MGFVQQDRFATVHEGPCSDCGRLTAELTQCFDEHTYSTLDLCGNCVPAFHHRQHFAPGCCGLL